MRPTTLSRLLSIAGAVRAQQTAWGQCGGIGWSGATTCVSGYTCTYSNPYYSQCLPGSSTPSTTAAASSKTTLATSKSMSAATTKSSSVVSLHTTSSSTKTTSTAASSTISGGGSTGYPGTTLQNGYYWIRAVESPNFHKYLQTSPEYKPGTAILDSYTTAGQFQIISGQLVELISGGFLYANVQQQANSTVNKLAVTFETTQNTYGTFAFSGDAVQWSISSISRPNLSAWLVCANQQLFINLGAYAYLTPAGCADETIHFYNGATAVP